MIENRFSILLFYMGTEKTVWKNTLTKQGRAIAPLHIKNASKTTKKS